MVHVLVATLHVADDSNINKIQDLLVQSAKIYARDKETLSWRPLQDTSDPRKFIIVERYEREASLRFHRENPQYEKFKATLGPLVEGEIQVDSYTELDTREGRDHWTKHHPDPSVADVGANV